jgi:hypothetical protein
MRGLVFATAAILLVAASATGYGQHILQGAQGFAAPRRNNAPGKAAKKAAQTATQTATQTSTSPTRDTQAVTLANQSLKAITGGLAVTNAMVQGTSTFIAGSDQQSGNATLEASVGYQSRIILSLSGGQRTMVRNGSGGAPQGKSAGADGAWQQTALHNCWTDPTWFFPAISIQSALNDPQIAFTYIGADTKAGVSVQHIQISRLVPGQIASATQLIQQLSRTDIYVDATTYLPVAIDFNEHPDFAADLNTPVEILFSGWQAVNGIQMPPHIQKFLQGSLSLDLSGLTVSVNTSIPQSDFTI